MRKYPGVQAAPLQVVEFDYNNHRGENHRYQVDVESFEVGPYDASGTHEHHGPWDLTWVLNGFVVTMDGKEREGTPRRTFLLNKIQNFKVVS